MYIGRYYHTLETKNRVSLPSKFREQMQGQGILTRGLDGCLALYDEAGWQRQMERIAGLGQTKRSAREYIRFLTNDAQEIEIDGQGRMLVTEELKEQASLRRDVVFVGSRDHIEIWDKEKYHAYIDQVRSRIEDEIEEMEVV